MKKESVSNDYTLKSKKYSGGFKSFLSDWMILFLFVVLLALCCLKPEFRTTTNIMNILRQASFVAIIAMGEFLCYSDRRNGYVYFFDHRHGLHFLRGFLRAE